MTEEGMKAHIGGLVKLTTQLFWYNYNRPPRRPGLDGTPGRIGILMNVGWVNFPDASPVGPDNRPRTGAWMAIEVLIDGMPIWIPVTDKDVRLMEGRVARIPR